MVGMIRGMLITAMAAKEAEGKDSRKKKMKKDSEMKEQSKDGKGSEDTASPQAASASELRKSMEDDKRLKELSSSFYEMQNRLQTMEMNNKGLGEELNIVRNSLAEIKDNMKNLLLIYEVIAKTDNPFVTGGEDYGGYSDLDAAQALASEELPPEEEADGLMASQMLMFSSLFQALRKTENHMEDILKKRMADLEPELQELESLDSWYGEFKDIVEMHCRHRPPANNGSARKAQTTEAGEAAEKAADQDTAESHFAVQDHNRLLSSIRITEHYLEKMVVQMVMGQEPSRSDIDKMDHWYLEFVEWR